ncbi:virulence factor SrfB, partial [Acinetobacter baumannii]
TCTQIVYLYNEIAKKLELTPSDMFRLLGRRNFNGVSEKLRIASMDIGGGTTDLMIVSYAVDPPGSDALAPVQNFREGFRKAGDDIL